MMTTRNHVLGMTGLAMIFIGGLVHGHMTHRWSPNTAVTHAVATVNSIPDDVENWTTTSLELSPAEITIGGIDGYLKRRLVNQRTGAEVTVLLVAGNSGPISLHPPTACFSGRGYDVIGSTGRFPISLSDDSGKAEKHVFHYADFRNSAIDDPALIRVYWAWSTDGIWESPQHPRMTYAGAPALYKLYISERWIPQGANSDTGAGMLLMEDLLPVIQKALRGSPHQS